VVYFENFNFPTFISCLLNRNFVNQLFLKRPLFIYYFDATPFAKRFLGFFLTVSGNPVSQLDFEMREVRDKNGELVRTRIPRVDLFEIQKKMINSEAYKALYHDSWKQGRIADYINKGLVDEGIMNPVSVSRVLFIIEVVYWHMQKNKLQESLFIINKRPWFELYKEFAVRYRINLQAVIDVKLKFSLSDMHKIVRKFPKLYALIRNFKYNKTIKNNSFVDVPCTKLYVEGRGDVNFSNDGEHSDFFWQLNSNFSAKNILYKHHSNTEKKYLEQHGVLSVGEGAELEAGYKRNYKKPEVNYVRKYKAEAKVIQELLDSYDLERIVWSSFFKKYNVRVFFSWYKYTNHHMAISDAIDDNDGISVIWQMAFDGFETAESMMNVDVAFINSVFSYEIEKRQASKIKYNVITGYPKDYVSVLLQERAKDLRKKLQANGAEKIVFVIDENSIDDSRWHTGHELQQENYSFILEEVLANPWLGVVFKPKAAKTLRQRLGRVAELLAKAEKTGRCFVYEVSSRHTTSAPPILAGLSADVCIHGHFCSGTAALECALEGLPTLLVDREGTPESKLNELSQGKVVFKDWPTTIKAVMEYFNSPERSPGFGDWSSIIGDLDPFRDGKAACRMGTYLNWLIQGYEQGIDKSTIMETVAEKYRKQWGQDKVINNNKLIYREI